ncbi:ArgE/DapE family deacylase [Rubrobacter taiwanensis]|uniref:ArgE/DapE family deacylase n=1 Tax=Rubrobacter taiwanensis TaxID=185139 RepID=UPI001A9EF533|nr:ArgE/DapE family deacylase [Rubrobacter taiwanensis]
MNDEIRTGLLRRIERNWEQELEFLRGLVRRPSTLGNEAPVQRYIARELEEMGLKPDIWQIDPAEISRMPGYSPVEWPYESRPNVAATLRGSGGGRSLILNGHVDVVPATPEHHWTCDPWGAEISDGRMYGRGAADMKSGIAAMIYAVRAIKEEDIALEGDLTLETVIEEECTGNGTLSARARGYTADAAIIPEPFAQTALEAQVGVMWARVTVRGQGAHAERASGAVNAISKAYPMMEAVKELEAKANAAGRPAYFAGHEHPLNYNIGRIRGGDWTSSVPEECTFEVRIACYPGEDLKEVQRRFKRHLMERAREDSWLSENPPEIVFYAFQAEGCTVERSEPLFATLGEQHRSVTGKELQFYSFTGTTDIRFFNLYSGISATCYGPLGGNLHAPDEWVDLESVKSVTQVLALSIVEWCSSREPLSDEGT